VKSISTERTSGESATTPDIKVANTREAVIKGRDEQLEAAVADLLKEIK
jgi:hypothetical protein